MRESRRPRLQDHLLIMWRRPRSMTSSGEMPSFRACSAAAMRSCRLIHWPAAALLAAVLGRGRGHLHDMVASQYLGRRFLHGVEIGAHLNSLRTVGCISAAAPTPAAPVVAGIELITELAKYSPLLPILAEPVNKSIKLARPVTPKPPTPAARAIAVKRFWSLCLQRLGSWQQPFRQQND